MHTTEDILDEIFQQDQDISGASDDSDADYNYEKDKKNHQTNSSSDDDFVVTNDQDNSLVELVDEVYSDPIPGPSDPIPGPSQPGPIPGPSNRSPVSEYNGGQGGGRC